MTRLRAAVAAGLLVVLVATGATAQAPRLGTIDFPTSGPPEAQAHFLRGALFLHSFEYSAAAEAFRAAQEAAPEFVMAYWGEAMTYNHPIWDERDRDAASAALRRLAPTREERRALAPTERERGYLRAVETLWADGPKAERDTAYMREMRALAEAYPDDLEAQAFHALSLLGLSSGVRVVPTYMRAAAIAEQVYDANPRHPGAVHYLIHSYDDPVHAPLGLRAAYAYANIAPDAAHAQHMTTHIFLAMGMWPEVVSQNTIAANLTGWWPGHYTSWLGYGLEQQGRFQDARAHLERARALLAERPRAGSRSYLALMRARHVVNTEGWDDPVVDWPIELDGNTWVAARAADAFVQGAAALRRGHRKAAHEAQERIAAASDQRSRAVEVMSLELQALLALDGGRTDEALAFLDEATAIEDAMPVEFGPPDIVKPSHELLGEVLLDMGRAGEAQREFERALALAPRRALALRGLGRSAEAAGDDSAAERAWNSLLEVLQGADVELPMLAEARAHVTSSTRD